jgi:hypothetical protein
MERFVIVVIAMVLYLIYRAVQGSNQRVGRPQGSMQTVYCSKSYPFSEISPDPNFPHVRSIRTKIRGVTKRNPDGTNRQRIIRECCRKGDALCLVREPRNPVDPDAIQILRIVCPDDPEKPQRGEQLGYLSRELAGELAPRMDHDGFVLMAQIINVTGGESSRSLGINIEVVMYRPAVPMSQGESIEKRDHVTTTRSKG